MPTDLLPHLTPLQWVLALVAGGFVGISKTGLPGAGVVIVPLMAAVFSGRASPGALLPMLLVGDLFAVAWYRRHTQWPLLIGLVPWVLVGVASGAGVLWFMGQTKEFSQSVDKLIAIMVLIMIGVHMGRKSLGDRFQPHSKAGRAVVGATAGFATTVSNAAGPVTNIYLASAQIPKQQFIGTAAWFYLMFNALKVPIFVALSRLQPQSPMIDAKSLAFGAVTVPTIVGGVFLGRWLLHRISEAWFEGTVLALAGITCVYILIRI